MKKLLQISTKHKISKGTLRHRVDKYGILGQKVGNLFMYTDAEESKIITVPPKTVRVPKIKTSHNLIQTFRLMHPSLVAEEVAYALSIDLERVQIAFKQEYLTLPSKMNRD